MDAMAKSAGALNSAYSEYSDSIQRRVDSFKAAFTDLSATVIDSNLVKDVVDLGTTLLEVLEKVFGWLDKIGGILPVILGASSGLFAKNLPRMIESSGIGTLFKFFKDPKSVINGMRAAAASAQGFGSTVSALAGPISLAVTGVTMLAGALNKYQQSQIEAQRGIVIEKDSIIKEKTAIYDLYAAYVDAKEHLDDTTKSHDALEEAANRLAEALGIERDAVRDLDAEYKNLSLSQLQEAQTAATEKLAAAQLAAYDHMRKIGMDAAKFNSIFAWGIQNGSYDFSARSYNSIRGASVTEEADGLLRIYKALQEEQQRLRDEFGTEVANNEDYKKITGWIEFLKEDTEPILQAMDDYAEIGEKITDVQEGTTSSAKKFEKNLSKLGDTIANKLTTKTKLTQKELERLKEWLDECKYSSGDLASALAEYTKEAEVAPQESLVNDDTLNNLTSLREELAATTTALEDYKKAMEGGEKGDRVKQIAEIYKGAMEDLKSGRVDSNRVNALAEMMFTTEQLSDMGFDLSQIGTALQNEFFQALFDPEGKSKQSYGQRFADYIKQMFGDAGEIGVRDAGDGRFEFYYDSVKHLADALGIAEPIVSAFLDDLDAYGIEVMRSTEENAKLIETFRTIKQEAQQAGGSGDALGDFVQHLTDIGRTGTEIGRILKDLRSYGELNVSDAEIVAAIDRVKQKVQEVKDGAADTEVFDKEKAVSEVDEFRKYIDDTLAAPVEVQVTPTLDEEAAQAVKEQIQTEVSGGDAAKIPVVPQLDEEAAQALLNSFSDSDFEAIGVLFSNLVQQAGDVKEATQQFVDLLALVGFRQDQIETITNTILAINGVQEDLQQLEIDVDGAVEKVQSVDGIDATAQIFANTNPAFDAINKLVRYLNTLNAGVQIPIRANVNSEQQSDTFGNSKQQPKKTYADIKAFGARASGGAVGRGGDTLVNELGPELISDEGTAYIANGGKPGFVKLSKNAIVFNADETKGIFGGRVRGGRSPARASGTRGGLLGRMIGGLITKAKAYAIGGAEGAAYKKATIKVKRCPRCGSSVADNVQVCPYCSYNFAKGGYLTSGTKTYTTTNSGTSSVTKWNSGSTSTRYNGTVNYTHTKAVQSYGGEDLFSYGGSGSGGGVGGYGGSGSGSGSGYDSASKSDPQKVDWIAVRLDRLNRAVEDLEKIAGSAFKNLSKRLGAAKSEISKLNEEIDANNKGYERYIKEAESVGLDPGIAQLVRNGAIDIAKYDDDTREKIAEYQEWYEKALDCKSAIEDLNQQIAELYQGNFENVQKDYENQLGLIEHNMNMINQDIAMAEAKGMLDSAKYYEQLVDSESQSVQKMRQELAALEGYFKEAMDSGKIDENSEAWYEMTNEINATKEAIAEANVQLAEYAKTIREIKWGYFDYAQERFKQLTQEADFLINLMSNDKLFDKRGQFNDTGLATVGMRAASFDAYMAQADEYAKEMRDIEQELTRNPYDTALVERRETLLGLQQQSIQAAESEKDAVRSLVQEGINLELSALKELIDAYTESLDSAKDLYDYQKKVSEQTADIATIQKQLAAYQGDTSEENRARVQKLQKDLQTAQTNLRETEWERSISEQKQLLDDVYTEYEELLNGRLDNVDLLMKEMIDQSNANTERIRAEIERVSYAVGYQTSGEMNTALAGNYANYDRMFESVSGMNTVLANIYANVNAMARAAGAVKAYASGGLVDYTGLAMVHGSPGNPEMVLSAADTAKFLEAARLMQSSPAMDLGKQRELLKASGLGGTSIGQLQVNIPIERVQDYNDLVRQMRDDPKFEKLVSAMTLDRAAGKSKFSKSKVVI